MNLEEITDSFRFFDDWEDKYRFIIDLGKTLPVLPDADRTEQNLIRGCQSQVWLVSGYNPESGRLELQIDSDAHIVRGLAAIVLAALGEQTPQAIADFDMDGLFDELGLLSHLSPTRGNGLTAMVKEIRRRAVVAEQPAAQGTTD